VDEKLAAVGALYALCRCKDPDRKAAKDRDAQKA